MKLRFAAVACGMAMIAAVAFAQNTDAGYQSATVISIEKLAADAQHPENGDQFKIAMRMADTIYLCRSSAPSAAFLDWSSGKQFPARLNGKVLEVKNFDGQMLQLNITGKKKPK
jgi:hypothetical protein